jgi:hypothetical protein
MPIAAARITTASLAISTAAVLLHAACTAGNRTSLVTRTDSAGVTIVESPAASWAPDESWRLEGPIVSIGSLDGPEETQLHRVRAVRLLPDGRVVVADGGTMELRLYAPDGRWIRSIGRAGDGPGEFRLFSGVQVVPPDTLIIFDNAGPRVTVYLPDGTMLESRRVAAPGEGVEAPDHRLPDGRWLDVQATVEIDGFQRRRNYMAVWSEGESQVDTLLQSDGQEYLIYRRYQGSQYLGRGAVVTPFGGQDLAAIGPGLLALSDGKSHDIAVLEVGRGQARYRRSRENRPLPDGAVSRFIDEYVARYSPDRQAEVRSHFAQLSAAEQTPAHSAMAFDRSGNLWAENYRFPWDSLARRTWAVYARTGEWLGDVEYPRALRVFEIGDDLVAGIERDDDGVEYVRIYRIVRPA